MGTGEHHDSVSAGRVSVSGAVCDIVSGRHGCLSVPADYELHLYFGPAFALCVSFSVGIPVPVSFALSFARRPL
jgi:hypothetical protein